MTEMHIIDVTKNSTGDKRLDSVIKKIHTEFSHGIKASHNIARELEKIKKEELYRITGAENFSDFARKYFGISKSNASRLTAIAEKFLHEIVIDSETGKPSYVYEDYQVSKLIEMLKATPEQLAMITSDMTVREIRDFINGKAIEDNTDSNDGSDESESEKTDKENSYDLAMAVQALKDRIRNAISYINTSDDEMFAEDAFSEVLEWIDELF